MAKKPVETQSGTRLPMDADGTVKAIEFGTYGTLAAGGLAAIGAANTAPLLLIAAVPFMGGIAGSAWGYVSGRRKGLADKKALREHAD